MITWEKIHFFGFFLFFFFFGKVIFQCVLVVPASFLLRLQRDDTVVSFL